MSVVLQIIHRQFESFKFSTRILPNPPRDSQSFAPPETVKVFKFPFSTDKHIISPLNSATVYHFYFTPVNTRSFSKPITQISILSLLSILDIHESSAGFRRSVDGRAQGEVDFHFRNRMDPRSSSQTRRKSPSAVFTRSLYAAGPSVSVRSVFQLAPLSSLVRSVARVRVSASQLVK